MLPHMEYCSAVWSNRSQSQTNQRKVQKRAARFIMNETYETASAELFKTVEKRFDSNRVVMMYKYLHNLALPSNRFNKS